MQSWSLRQAVTWLRWQNADRVAYYAGPDGEFLARAADRFPAMSAPLPEKMSLTDACAFLMLLLRRGTLRAFNRAGEVPTGFWMATYQLPLREQYWVQDVEFLAQCADAPAARAGVPGRPSSAHIVLAECQRRLAGGEAESTIAAEARLLSAWLSKEYPTMPQIKPRSAANLIRAAFGRGRKH